MEKELEKPDEQLGFLLMQVSMLKQRTINATLKKLDLTYIQFIILAAVFELEVIGKIVTQQTISTERLLDKAMVSNVVKTLIKKKLIIRNSHPEDSRAYVLKVTDKGELLVRKGKEIAKNTDKLFFADIDEEIMKTFLKKILIQKYAYYKKSE